MKSLQKGFTLIELMIVVAIVGILSAIAVPAYQNYTVRAKVTEGLTAAEAVKTAVSEYIITNGALPSSSTNVTLGLPEATNYASTYVSSITVIDNGAGEAVIKVAFNPEKMGKLVTANANQLELRSLTNTTSGVISWQCGPGSTNGLSQQLLPSSCKSSVS